MNGEYLTSLQDQVKGLTEWTWEEKYQLLTTFDIELPKNPELNLKSFNEKIAEIQTKKDHLSRWYKEAIRYKQVWSSTLKTAKRFFGKEKSQAMLIKEVYDLKNQAMQDAKVGTILVDVLDMMAFLEDKNDKAESYVEACKVTMDNLDSANKNLVQQIKVVQQMIDIRELSNTDEKYLKSKF